MTRRAAAEPAPADALLDPKQVAALLGNLSVQFVQRHAADLGGRLVGNRLRFRRADVDAYLDARRVLKPAAPSSPTAAPTSLPAVRVARARREGIGSVTGTDYSALARQELHR